MVGALMVQGRAFPYSASDDYEIMRTIHEYKIHLVPHRRVRAMGRILDVLIERTGWEKIPSPLGIYRRALKIIKHYRLGRFADEGRAAKFQNLVKDIVQEQEEYEKSDDYRQEMERIKLQTLIYQKERARRIAMGEKVPDRRLTMFQVPGNTKQLSQTTKVSIDRSIDGVQSSAYSSGLAPKNQHSSDDASTDNTDMIDIDPSIVKIVETTDFSKASKGSGKSRKKTRAGQYRMNPKVPSPKSRSTGTSVDNAPVNSAALSKLSSGSSFQKIVQHINSSINVDEARRSWSIEASATECNLNQNTSSLKESSSVALKFREPINEHVTTKEFTQGLIDKKSHQTAKFKNTSTGRPKNDTLQRRHSVLRRGKNVPTADKHRNVFHIRKSIQKPVHERGIQELYLLLLLRRKQALEAKKKRLSIEFQVSKLRLELSQLKVRKFSPTFKSSNFLKHLREN